MLLMAVYSRYQLANKREDTMTIAYSYPGQSEAVRIGLGTTVWVHAPGDMYPSELHFTWRDAPYPAETHSPAEFLAAFPPKPGGRIERSAKEKGLL